MTAQELAPVVFEPILKEKIWGGDNLSRKLQKKLPAGTRIGESWEISGYGNDLSVAISQPVEGLVMSDLLRIYGEAILGSSKEYSYFPLLFKFIDAQDKLSVQVHPDDEQAASLGLGSYGKSECWYVVDAEPDAHIIAGFRPGVSTADIQQAIETKQLESLLNYTPVKKGDVIFIPAGTVHAILGGILIYEVQETSDITFRLYDWDRLDENGERRNLHIQESLQVLDTSCHEHCKIAPVACADFEHGFHAFRAVCRYFALEEYKVSSQSHLSLPEKTSFQVITVLSGDTIVETQAGTREIKMGETVLLPAQCNDVRIDAKSESHFLVTTIPDISREVIQPLRALGVSDERICGLGGHGSKNNILKLL